MPQEDIIHRELPLASTLRYSAWLRLPSGTTRTQIDQAVTEAMDALDLAERADIRVGSLSGGQRKRASIAAELLTRPRVFFLDEPTSGLDPATGAELMRQLRRLADSGRTVVLTTHTPADVAICDKVVFLARDGHLAFVGTPEQAKEYFDVDAFEDVYERLGTEATPEQWGRRFAAEGDLPADARPIAARGGAPVEDRSAGPLAQWWTLTRRNVEILVRNRLTLAIVLGSPVLVVAMLAVLFQPGAFDFADPSPSATLQILFWVAFGGFFFGLTYGLLQIATELPIVRRERLVNLGIVPYVLSKVTVLMPLLLLVNVLMLGVLRATDRMPAAGFGTYTSLTVTLLLDAAVGARARPPCLGGRHRSDPGHARAADALLPGGAVLRRDPAGAADGEGRRRPSATRSPPAGRSRRSAETSGSATCSAKAARRSGRRSSRSTATASRTPSGSTGRSWAGSRPSAWLRRARCSPPSAGPPASRRYRLDAIQARKALPMTVGVPS